MERLAPGEAEPLRPESLAAPRPRPGAAPPAPRDRRASGSDAGSVTLRVQPGDATILIDGQRWNAASDEPLTVQLDAGPHTVEVRKAGFRGYITEVNVEPGRSLPLNISLSPE
jgi:hypothetical protein